VFVFVRLNTSRMFANMFAVIRMFAGARGDHGKPRPEMRQIASFFSPSLSSRANLPSTMTRRR
jgi:hypothetical protein